MPRYFVDTYAAETILDEDGHVYPDRDTVRREVHRTLSAMMREALAGQAATAIGADVRDESGRRVLRATLVMSMVETA